MIEKIIGDDLLTMGERTKLIASITDVVDNTRILQDWMIEENARMKHEGQMAYAREEGMAQGIAEGIKKGLEQGIEQGSEKRKKEIIINMLNKGYKYEDISDITDTPIKKIKKIEEEIRK